MTEPDGPDFDLLLENLSTPEHDGEATPQTRTDGITKSGRNLYEFDFELLLDMSGSMGTTDCHEVTDTGKKRVSRWNYARGFTLALGAKLVKYDTNGIVVVPFNHGWEVKENVATAAQVQVIFDQITPDGGTDTAGVLNNRLEDYFAQQSHPKAKKRVIIVVTDGAFDKTAVAAVIGKAQRRVKTGDELSMQFIQVGYDNSAAACLEYLDDNLGEPDLVDTTTFDEIEELPFVDLVDKIIDG